MSVLKTAKLTVLSLARHTGLTTLVRDSRWRAKRLLILAYHGVSLDDEHQWSPTLYMPPNLLRERFRLLRDSGSTVLPLAEALQRLYAGTLPPRAVALTFDDGQHDFATVAVPILREFGYPATVYVTTYYAERGGPVFDIMSRYLLWKARGTVMPSDGIIQGDRPLDLRTDRSLAQSWGRVHAFAREKSLSADEKDVVLRTIAERAQVDYERLLRLRLFHIMTPEEVAGLPRDLVDVQLHTHRHRVPLDRDQFMREITENRDSLFRMRNGTPAVHFCYPSGVTNPAFLDWLREAQVQSATTCATGLASPHSEPLLLPRLVDTTPLSTTEFEGWLSGVSAFLPRRKVQTVQEA